MSQEKLGSCCGGRFVDDFRLSDLAARKSIDSGAFESSLMPFKPIYKLLDDIYQYQHKVDASSISPATAIYRLPQDKDDQDGGGEDHDSMASCWTQKRSRLCVKESWSVTKALMRVLVHGDHKPRATDLRLTGKRWWPLRTTTTSTRKK